MVEILVRTERVIAGLLGGCLKVVASLVWVELLLDEAIRLL